MAALDEEDVVEQMADGREAAAGLKWQRQPGPVGDEPRAPLRPLGVRVGQHLLELDRRAHDPITSSTLSTRTGAELQRADARLDRLAVADHHDRELVRLDVGRWPPSGTASAVTAWMLAT